MTEQDLFQLISEIKRTGVLRDGIKLGLNGIQRINTLVTSLQDLLEDSLPVAEPEIKQILTYSSVIEYFVDNRPDNPYIAKGAILRQFHPRGQAIIQIFLDKNNELVCLSSGRPYGRKIITRRLDQELLDAFDNKDLIIVE